VSSRRSITPQPGHSHRLPSGAPASIGAKQRFAPSQKFMDEIAADITLAIAEHFGQEFGLSGSRKVLPARIAGAR
jgi:hypothetical protein